jgi:nitroimidazol reductase NimA-like FMN-containing flavoprotein (pyridoxamine 5'-phosphate oxidase superfamily)
VEEVLQAEIPARLATIDGDGYPRITPISFIWADGAFVMTSRVGRPHLENLARDPRAALAVDIEGAPSGGRRPNKRLRVQGPVELFHDDGEWTRRITRKYLPGPEGDAAAEARAKAERLVIRLRPIRTLAKRSP